MEKEALDMKAGVYYHPDFADNGYPVLKDRVKPGFDGLYKFIKDGKIQLFTPEIDEEAENLLAATHSSRHIASVNHSGYHEVSLLSAAGVVQAATKLAQGDLEFAFCFVGAAGHHAGYDHYWGFCFYNDVAMAVKKLRTLGINKIMIIDVDPHFGDGTRDLLGNDPDVIHINFYSGFRKTHYDSSLRNYDIAISGATDEVFLHALDSVLGQEWDFELLIVIFGHDSHHRDYGGFNLSNMAYPQFAQKIKNFALEKPVLFVLSGGSNPQVARDVIPAIVEVFVK